MQFSQQTIQVVLFSQIIIMATRDFDDVTDASGSSSSSEEDGGPTSGQPPCQVPGEEGTESSTNNESGDESESGE